MEGVEVKLVEGHPDALLMTTRENVIRLGSFRKGLYEVQDASSQLIAPFLQVEAGMSVIDACAGAGGKTLHLAAMMENEGNITAMDVEGWKLGELQKRARRAGVSIVETQQIRNPKDIKNLYESADRLLLDAPCTGMGVLRRNPDAKWKLTSEHTDWVRNTQTEILEDYSMMLRPGGKMVYATCSIMPSENERQVENFLANNPEYILEEMHHTWPSEGWDGFFMARMRKG
jgi:16S rRNA (cytosine967-C5)-methyltransferase